MKPGRYPSETGKSEMAVFDNNLVHYAILPDGTRVPMWDSRGSFGVRPYPPIDVPPVFPPTTPLTPKLRATGTRIETIVGTPFVWKGITAFSLIANGLTTEPFLDYAAATGFNVVRVLTCVLNDFADLAPEDGLARLPHLLQLARARGLYVEVVGLSDTQTFLERGRGFDWRAHARNVATVCAGHENAVFEFANEPYHATHVEELHDMANAQAEAAIATDGLDVLWAPGASPDDESIIPFGRFVTRHLDRSRDLLNQVRRVKALDQDVQQIAGVPTINDEPMGADEEASDNRSNEPWFFYAMGALEAGFGIGGTFHCEAGLTCAIPGPVTHQCALAYLQGKRMVPEGEQGYLDYRNIAHEGSPVVQGNLEDPGPPEDWFPIQDPNGGPIIRAYSFVHRANGWTVVLSRNPLQDPSKDLVWAWSRGTMEVIDSAPYPYVQVYRVTL
jgi:hypothetical protein